MTFPVSAQFILYVFIAQALTLVNAAPFPRLLTRAATDFRKQNGLKAQQLNAQFASLATSDPCREGSIACINNSFAQCSGGKWVLSPCPGDLDCFALPLVNSPGTSIACDTKQDALARISASGAAGGLAGSSGNNTSRSTATMSFTPSGTNTMTNTASTPTSGGGTNNTTGDHSSGDHSSNDNDCDNDALESSTPNGNSTHTVQGGNSTSYSNSNLTDNDCDGKDGTDGMDSTGNETDCDHDEGNGSNGSDTARDDTDCDDEMTSSTTTPTRTSTVTTSHVSPTESSQLYHRQFFTGTASLSQMTQPFATTLVSSSNSFPSPFQTGTPSSASLFTFSGSLTTVTPTNTATAVPSINTITLVSTVTVTVPSCQSSDFPTHSGSTFLLSSTSRFISASTFVPSISSAVIGNNNPASPNMFTSPSPTPTTSSPLNNAPTNPTVANSSGAPFNAGGISFTTQGDAAFEPTPMSFTTAMTLHLAGGPSPTSSFNLAQLLTATM